MIERTLVKIYAEALYEIAEGKGCVDEVREELHGLEELFGESKELKTFLTSPKVDEKEKKRLVEKVFRDILTPVTYHFLLTLVDKNREILIPHMADEFKNILDRINNRIDVDVTSAVHLEEAVVRKIKEKLSRTLEKDIVLRLKTNPTILGGIIVRVEDRVLDGSLLEQLEKLRARMLGNVRRRIEVNEDSA